MDADRKARKEAFVSNLAGGTKTEIWTVISCLPVCMCIGAALQQLLLRRLHRQDPQQRRQWLLVACFACEFGAVVLPQVAVSMSAVGALPLLLGALGVAAVILGLAARSSADLDPGQQQQQQQQQQQHPVRPGSLQHGSTLPRPDCWQHMAMQLAAPRLSFVSWFRGGVMLYTCIAILAVDFRTFPRRFAKAEHFGTGLMDLGVGATIFAGGLVSSSSSSSAAVHGVHAAPLRRRLARALRGSAPVVALGLGRLVSVKALAYQEHVGEYGTHWNFFLTVAAVNFLTVLVNPGRRALLPLAVGVVAGYQWLLSERGWSGWVQDDARPPSGWVGQNKEGLCSLWGYWGLYLLGAAAAARLRDGCQRLSAALQDAAAEARAAAAAARASSPRRRQPQRPPLAGRAAAGPGPARLLCWWLARWVALDASLWGLLLVAEATLEPVSRRACNLAYVVWVAAQCSDQLLLCFLAQLLCDASGRADNAPRDATGAQPALQAVQQQQQQRRQQQQQQQQHAPVSLANAFNRNLLALFLLANLLTGLVNTLVDTLELGHPLSRLVVGTYMLAVCSVAAAWHQHGVTLKLA